jgi:hypothetical protein
VGFNLETVVATVRAQSDCTVTGTDALGLLQDLLAPLYRTMEKPHCR